MAYREASRIPAVTLEELVGSNPTIEMVIREPIGDLAVGNLMGLICLGGDSSDNQGSTHI